MRSPALTSMFALPGKRLRRVPRMRIFLPVAPGPPPASPYGAIVRRSVSTLTFESTMHSSSRINPSPPRAASAAAGVATNSILGDPHRVVSLERLDRRVERVGHVSVDAGRAGPILRSARAAGDRFVIRKMAVAKSVEAADREIRHRARTRRWNPIRRGLGERAKQHVNDSLRGLDVSARDRCRSQRVDDRAGRRDQLDRTHQAFVGGHRFRREAFHDVESRRQRDREVCVDLSRAPAARSR